MQIYVQQAATQLGDIDFYEYINDTWAIFFSHPKDFTPVCTTELGEVQKRLPEFSKRGVKVLALSIDTKEDHAGMSLTAQLPASVEIMG